jgi:hypothetical protein
VISDWTTEHTAKTMTTNVTDEEQACSIPSRRCSSTVTKCAPAMPSSPTLAMRLPTAPDRAVATASGERKSKSHAQLQLRSWSARPGTSGIAMPSNGYFTTASTMSGAKRKPSARLAKAAARTSPGAASRCDATVALARYGARDVDIIVAGMRAQRPRPRRSSCQ